MPISNKLRITDLDFEQIKINLKEYLRAQTEFEDYDFEGSGLAILIDLLAYNTHYMGYYANMLANEMFLDSSALRESILSHAKHLNVFPTSRRSASAMLNMTFSPSGAPTALLIDKGTRFTTSINGIRYGFLTPTSTTVPRSATGTYSVTNLKIVEGQILRRSYVVNGADPEQRFILPNTNVDTTTITVTVQKSASDTTLTTYKDATSLDVNTVKSSDNVFFLEEIEGSTYELFFGDGSVGTQVEDGNIIFIEYITTLGAAANQANVFTAVGTVASLTSNQYILETSVAATGGSEKQSDRSLKFQAPKLYSAQRRATTKEDYKAIILEQRPDIESITVYGGEDADPVQYGKVFVAVKPSGNNTFSTTTKDEIKTTILDKVNVVTVQPEIIDPIFFYLLIDATVNYDPVKLLTDAASLEINIDTSIQSYFQTDLEKFDQKFRYSQLVQDIDLTDSAVRNNKTNIRYQQRIVPNNFSVAQTFTQYFTNALKKGSFVSTSFTGADGNTYSLVDDSSGNIKAARTTSGVVDSPAVYLTQPDGTKNQGTIDYDTGKVELNGLIIATISDGTQTVRLTVTPEVNNSDIIPLREQVLTYDVTDTESIKITMNSETII